MLSSTYSSQLKPDPCLRIAVQASAHLFCFVGLIILLQLPLSSAARLLACTVWAAHSVHERRRLQVGFKTIKSLRIHAGGVVEVQNARSEWQAATLLSGSLVLRQVAWLRLKTDNGAPTAELLRRETQCDQQWRRLQVIWRHIGASA